MLLNIKIKKKKLESIPRINRRLFKLWSEKARERANNTCEYCGRKVGDLNIDGKPLTKVDSHHIQSRKVKDNPLKFDLSNAVVVCPLHHKFSCVESFHRSPVVTIDWLIKHHPERYNHILKHFKDTVDLQNREVLREIEACLNEGKTLDIDKLKEIEKLNPREVKPPKSKATLFDEFKKSSSSSSSES